MILRVRDEDDAPRRHGEDARPTGDDGMRRERDELRLQVANLEGRVDELRRHRRKEAGWSEDTGGGDSSRVRRRMEEGPFGSNQGPNHSGGPYGGGKQFRKAQTPSVSSAVYVVLPFCSKHKRLPSFRHSSARHVLRSLVCSLSCCELDKRARHVVTRPWILLVPNGWRCLEFLSQRSRSRRAFRAQHVFSSVVLVRPLFSTPFPSRRPDPDITTSSFLWSSILMGPPGGPITIRGNIRRYRGTL